MPVVEARRVMKISRHPISLDRPVGESEDSYFGDFIEDAEAASAESAVISRLMHSDVRSVLATLDEREQQVIRLRFGLDDGQPRTLDQIGKLFWRIGKNARDAVDGHAGLSGAVAPRAPPSAGRSRRRHGSSTA